MHVFLEFFSIVPNTIFFPSQWPLSNIAIDETMIKAHRGVNPVTMTTINPRKEFLQGRGSNQRPRILLSSPIEDRGSVFPLNLMKAKP